MPRVRRHVALGCIGLVVGALALTGCVTTESVYDDTYGGSSYLGYDPYWTPPLEYRHGYPGYYSYYGYYGYPGYSAYPRYFVYSPGYYSYRRYYGPTIYPPPPGHARRDRDRDGRGGGVTPPATDRQPRSTSGSRRPPPEYVPTEGPGDDAPTPRRRGRQEPPRQVPE